MSKLRKMKLTPIDRVDETINPKSQRLLTAIDISTSPYLKGAADLDYSIRNILNSDLDEYQKVKLYSQELKKFLLFKYRYNNPQVPLDESSSGEIVNEYISSPTASSTTSVTPILSTSAKRKTKLNKTKKTPQTIISNPRPYRFQKIKAQDNLRKYFMETDDDESNGNTKEWLPYNTPKRIQSIRTIKSQKKK